jgi:hypothetical protein
MRKKLINSIVLLCIAWGLTSVTIGFVTSDPPVSITFDSEHYIVNENGDLTIQIQGIITGVSSIDCDVQLKIPLDFEMPTLPDGSPVLEILNEGSPTILIENGTEFHSSFTIRTYNSTALPLNYTFNVNSPKVALTKLVIPQWPQIKQASGGGASLASPSDPYIVGFWAYNSNKGEKGLMKTFITNPSYSQPKRLTALKYLTTADDYNDWTDEWTPEYYEPTFIYPRQTWVVHDYLDYYFTAQSGKKYAFNGGWFNVTEVYAYDNSWPGQEWSDSYYPNLTEGDFVVGVEPGTHPVFVICLTNDEWYDYPYLEPSLYIEAASARFEHDYDIELHTLHEFEWDPPSDASTSELLELSKEKAGDDLKLSGKWKNQGGPHPDNHGFDVLAGFTGYRSDHYGRAGGYSANHLVVTGGNAVARLESNAIDNVFQHELSHCYGAGDPERWDWEIWDGHPSVMSRPLGVTMCNNWGYTDHDVIYDRRDQFDGYA